MLTMREQHHKVQRIVGRVQVIDAPQAQRMGRVCRPQIHNDIAGPDLRTTHSKGASKLCNCRACGMAAFQPSQSFCQPRWLSACSQCMCLPLPHARAHTWAAPSPGMNPATSFAVGALYRRPSGVLLAPPSGPASVAALQAVLNVRTRGLLPSIMSCSACNTGGHAGAIGVPCNESSRG